MADQKELFFAVLAITIGIVFITGSIFNWRFLTKLEKIDLLDSLLGKRGLRIINALIGLILLYRGIVFFIN